MPGMNSGGLMPGSDGGSDDERQQDYGVYNSEDTVNSDGVSSGDGVSPAGNPTDTNNGGGAGGLRMGDRSEAGSGSVSGSGSDSNASNFAAGSGPGGGGTPSVGDRFGGAAATAGAALVGGLARGGKAAGDAVKKAFVRLGTMAMTAGTGLSGFLGGAISPFAGAVISGTGAVVMSIFMVGLVITVVTPSVAKREGLPLCSDLHSQQSDRPGTGAGEGDIGSGGAMDGMTEDNAKKIYGILSYAGMPDENIAGILGNWSTESNIDPTSVETILDEPQTIGPKKKAAEAAGFKISSIDAKYAAQFPKIDKAGIGLGQWTNERNTMLTDFAKSNNHKWYEIETQLGFMMGGDDPARVAVVQDMIKNSKGNPEAATMHFLVNWEGVNNGTGGQRSAAAGKWYAKMSGWDKDADAGKSVLEMAKQGQSKANSVSDREASEKIEPGVNCILGDKTGSGAGGNSDAATAMATYAYPFYDMGAGNRGTELYQWLHDEIFPGDPYYMSCDRGVATAVRWSGTDDTIPPGPTDVQYAYFIGEGKDKWERVDEAGGGKDESKLKPGDVLVTTGNGHILMYLGKDIIAEVHGGHDYDKNASMAQASFRDHSPGLIPHSQHAGDNRDFAVFRSKGGEEHSKYTDLKPPMPVKSVSK